MGLGIGFGINWGSIKLGFAKLLPSFILDFATISDDFTFTRSSFATRVNENGLIETVTDLGSELVTNGDFATDSDWNFTNQGGTKGWRIADNRAICDEAGVANGRNLESTTLLISGKKYRLNLDILQSQDNMQIYMGGSLLTETLPTGTNLDYSLEFTAPTTGLFTIYAGSSDTQEIDNISIQEVLEDDLPRIDYTNSTFENALGSELITNGDFATDLSSWSVQGGATNWVWDNGSALMNGNTDSGLFQDFGGNNTTLYEVTVDFTTTGTKGCRILDADSTNLFLVNGTNTFTTTLFIGRLYLKPHNSNGTGEIRVDNVSVKEVTGEIATDKGEFLLEPQSTNLVRYSEDFTQSIWNRYTGETVVTLDNSEVNPYGELGSYKITSVNAGSNLGRLGVNIGVNPNTDYTLSFYAKNIDATDIKNLITNVTTSSTNIYISEINSSGWSRVEFSFTSSTGTTCTVQVVRDLPVGESIYLWGVQVEELSYATSYIPTSGSTVTRSNETCVEATPTINSEEGVLYFEASALVNGGVIRQLSISDGGTSNYVSLRYSNNASRFQAFLRSNNGSADTLSRVGVPQTDLHKIAVRWDATTFDMWIDGAMVSNTTTTATPIGLNTFGFDSFRGRTKDLKIYTEALSDSELEDLTTL